MKKKYCSAGVLPILKTEDNKKYLVLVKRTKDAKTSPGVYSGFSGWANDKESFNPEVIAYRELLEEIFLVSRDKKKAYSLVFEQDIDLQIKDWKKQGLIQEE